MYNHDGTWDFLKLVVILVFVGIAVWWLQTTIGGDYTVLIILSLLGALVFGGGAMFAHMNQKQTLEAITKFNAQDAQIDKFRMQSHKASQNGEAAMQRAAAQLTVLNAKNVTSLATQRAKLLTDAERVKWNAENQQESQNAGGDLWDMDDDDEAGDDFKEWN